MEEVAPDRFASQVKALDDQADLEPLWEPLTPCAVRERSEAWQAWLAGEGDQPTVDERPVHVSRRCRHPNRCQNLDDALRSLDD